MGDCEGALRWAERGDPDAARAAVREHREDGWLDGAYDAYCISLCALAGAHDLAVEILERPVTWGSSYRYLAADPTLRSLRGHPGFERLLRARYERWTRRRAGGENLPADPPERPTPDELLAEGETSRAGAVSRAPRNDGGPPDGGRLPRGSPT